MDRIELGKVREAHLAALARLRPFQQEMQDLGLAEELLSEAELQRHAASIQARAKPVIDEVELLERMLACHALDDAA